MPRVRQHGHYYSDGTNGLLAEQERPGDRHGWRFDRRRLQLGYLATAVQSVPGSERKRNLCASCHYVYNIIKSANANTPSGSMNAMLKGQMLATALDVYFGGGPGGNPLGAPTPLGIVKIDLTKVCNMVDNTGGIGTCNGTSENVSSAFGGAPRMMLMNMLLYQNNVSNASGSTWYGNVKSVQALAKDVFDAINNQAANIAP